MKVDSQARPFLESSIVGGLLLDNSPIDTVKEFISHKDFSDKVLGHAFLAIERFMELNKPADALTIAEAIEGNEGCDNALYVLSEAVANTAAPRNSPMYAQTLNEHLRRIQLYGKMSRFQEMLNGDIDLNEVLENLNSEVQAFAHGIAKKFDGVTMNEALTSLVNQVDESFDGKLPPRLKTGYSMLDGMLQGMRPGNLVVLAARPSQGKTTFALNMACNVMRHQKKHVCMFSFEMSADEIIKSMVSHIGGINLQALKGECLSDADLAKFSYAVGIISQCSMKIYETGSGINTVKKTAKEYCRANPDCGLIIIDYIQLMTKKNAENRTAEVSAITREIKLLAKELGLPILALSQLNRNKDARADKSPVLSDLRDSGSIEQDADVVMFVERDGTEAKIVIGKNRSGPVGNVRMTFNGPIATFTEAQEIGLALVK